MKLKLFQFPLFILSIIAVVSCGSDDDITGGDNHNNGQEDIAISRFSLSRKSAIIATGDTIHLSCVITPANATNKKTIWLSQDPSIAIVSSEGIVTALAEGDCEISVKVESYPWTEKCKLHVINPDIYKAVDLGLPSRTKWGSVNAGYNLAWAETVYKDVYYWGWYKWCSENIGDYSIIKYCSEDQLKELKNEDDIAYINGAHKWRTPTKEEFQELIDNCTWTYEDLSYYSYYWNKQVVDGRYKVTGPNGNCIFFDFDGERYSNYTTRQGEIGVYWSRNIANEELVNNSAPGDDPYKYACVLVVSKNYYNIEPWARFYGIPTRPVRIEEK
ncbi:Ig-like domain-containing protein [Prevotella sp. E9-3]|uniref:Ig-like domain-containing protein n=1 Tax=Prevotella sp. E9-3 TaxID=2913621 RepID=UPI001EDB4880|nr:Ig-like domain-containing protein [Prevotella sp. E9-3]UKK47847.1 Ig-like domain-containing protein [Prevotella sp. E9-3]